MTRIITLYKETARPRNKDRLETIWSAVCQNSNGNELPLNFRKIYFFCIFLASSATEIHLSKFFAVLGFCMTISIDERSHLSSER